MAYLSVLQWQQTSEDLKLFGIKQKVVLYRFLFQPYTARTRNAGIFSVKQRVVLYCVLFQPYTARTRNAGLHVPVYFMYTMVAADFRRLKTIYCHLQFLTARPANHTQCIDALVPSLPSCTPATWYQQGCSDHSESQKVSITVIYQEFGS